MTCFQKNLLDTGSDIFMHNLAYAWLLIPYMQKHIIWKLNNFSEDCLPEVYLKEAKDILFWPW